MVRRGRSADPCTAAEADAPPWCADLLRYRALVAALAQRRLARRPAGLRAGGGLLEGRPVLNPVHLLATFDWPVHRIGPRYRGSERDGLPVRLVLFRNAIGGIEHLVVGAQGEALIAELARRRVTGQRLIDDLVRRLAAEQGADAHGLRRGLALLLEQFRARGLVLGSTGHNAS
jgi:hypothetical protein